MALKYLYAPSGYKGGTSSGTAYGVLPNNSSADFDNFDRPSFATRTNKDGLIESMGNNVPRLDYSDGGCPSLLLEPERTNLVVNSAEGTYGNAPASTAQTIAPDGTNTATIPTPNEVADRYKYVVSAGSATGDTKLTYSWYRKRLSTPDISTYIGDLHIYSLVNCIQVGSTIQIGSDIRGYDRFSATFDVTDGSLEAIIRLYFGELIGVGNSSIAYFGHQVEVGEYATSYIPTSGAIATRNNDAGNLAGNFDFNSAEGVLEARFKAFDTDNSSRRITLGATDSNRVVLGYGYDSGTVKPYLLIVASANDEIYINMPSSFNIFDYNTYQFKFKSGNNELKINGDLVDTDPTFKGLNFTFSASLTNISLNYYNNSSNRIFQGGLRHIKVYDSITDF